MKPGRIRGRETLHRASQGMEECPQAKDELSDVETFVGAFRSVIAFHFQTAEGSPEQTIFEALG